MRHVRLPEEKQRLPKAPTYEEAAQARPGRSLLSTAAFLVILAWGLAEARPFLIPLCIAALLAFLMVPMVNVMRRLRVPEGLAVPVAFLVLLLPLGAAGYLVVREGQALLGDIPALARGLASAITRLTTSPLGQRLSLEQHLNTAELTRRLVSGAGESLQFLLKGFGVILSTGSQTLLVLLFAVVMLASRFHLRRAGERILAVGRPRSASAEMLDDITMLIERFLIARFLIMLIIGGIDLGILVLFGMPYAFLLASFLGVMTIVPAIGFIISAIPPVIVSIISGKPGWATGAMAVALTVVSLIEGNVLTPRMVGKQLNLNALTTFVALFAGSLLWGIWGMLLAVPVVGILRIAFNASPTLQPWGDLLADRPSSEQVTVSRRAGHA